MPFVYYVMGMILKVENQVVVPPGPTLSIPRSLVWALDLSPALLGLFSKTQAHPHLQPFSKPMLKMLDVFRALVKCKWERNVNRRNIQNFCQKSKKYRRFLKKNRLQLKKTRDISVYFTDFLPIFWKYRRPPPTADLIAPSFPTLIWRSRFGSSSNSQFYVHLMVQIEAGCDPTTIIEPQQLCDDSIVRFRSNNQFYFPTIKWDSNNYFDPTFVFNNKTGFLHLPIPLNHIDFHFITKESL